MLNRALFSLYFESQLERNALGNAEMKAEFQTRKKNLRIKTFAINLGLINFYFLASKVPRKIVLAGNFAGTVFAYVNYRNHLFDDAIELMARNQITSE